MLEQHHLRQFLVLVFVLLLPCFALWTVASEPLARPAVGFVNTVLTHWFPDVVHALYIDGKQTLLMTQFGESGGKLIPLQDAEYRLGFPINTRLLSYSLPFYTALHFAMHRQDSLHTYILGLLVLYPLMALGLLCLCMKELMVNLGNTFLQQPDVFVPDANIIGLLYQLSVLIVPTLTPAAVWLWQNKHAQILQGVFNQLAPPEKTGTRR